MAIALTVLVALPAVMVLLLPLVFLGYRVRLRFTEFHASELATWRSRKSQDAVRSPRETWPWLALNISLLPWHWRLVPQTYCDYPLTSTVTLEWLYVRAEWSANRPWFREPVQPPDYTSNEALLNYDPSKKAERQAAQEKALADFRFAVQPGTEEHIVRAPGLTHDNEQQ